MRGRRLMQTGSAQRENKKFKDRKRAVFGSDGKNDREIKFSGNKMMKIRRH